MKHLKRLFDFYIQSSLHVALSCCALVQMTYCLFQVQSNNSVVFFAFFGTVVGYNFVKYDALARTKRRQMRNKLKVIALFSLGSFLAAAFFFFQLQRITQLISVVFLVFTLLYTLPFFPNRSNARNWAGVKIYIVALCWVGVTVVLPVLNDGIEMGAPFLSIAIQRFILIFVLILIFEIIDLAQDDPHLQTVPQQIGVNKTKQLGFLLLVLFFGLEMFNFSNDGNVYNRFLALLVPLVIALFLAFANEKRSKYYTSFWVESIPIFWWLLVLLGNGF
jgi:hypothetical protein